MSKKNKIQAAARARLGRDAVRRLQPVTAHLPSTQVSLDSGPESDWECGYSGGVNHDMSENGTEAKALASVKLVTIRRWEHRMQRWMEAYRSGLATNDAQRKVKEFSSAKYTSHRRIPEAVACVMD